MKKIALAVVALIVLAAGGYYFIQHQAAEGIRGGLENFARQQADGATFSFGDIEVDLLENRAVLNDLDLKNQKGEILQLRQVVFPNIRELDTGQPLGPQLRSFTITDLHIRDATEEPADLTMAKVTAEDSNLMALLEAKEATPAQIFGKLQAGKLEAESVVFSKREGTVAIEKLTARDWTDRQIGKANLSNVKVDGEGNRSITLGDVEVADFNLLAKLKALDLSKPVSDEAGLKLLSELKIGLWRVNKLTANLEEGDMTVELIDLDSLDQGTLKAFLVKKVDLDLADEHAVDIRLAELRVKDTNAIKLGVEASQLEDPGVKDFDRLMRALTLAEFVIDRLDADSKDGTGGIDAIRIAGVKDGIYDEVSATNGRLSVPEAGDFGLAKVLVTVKGRIEEFATDATYDIDNITFKPGETAPPELLAVLSHMEVETLDFSLDGAVKWDPAAKTMRYVQNYDLVKGASLNLNLDASELPTMQQIRAYREEVLKLAPEDIDPSAFAALLQSVVLDKIDLNLRDHGLIDVAFAFAAAQQGGKAADLKQAMEAQAAFLLAGLFGEQVGEQHAKTIGRFLTSQGELKISVATRDKQPVSALVPMVDNVPELMKRLDIAINHAP